MLLCGSPVLPLHFNTSVAMNENGFKIVQILLQYVDEHINGGYLLIITNELC